MLKYKRALAVFLAAALLLPAAGCGIQGAADSAGEIKNTLAEKVLDFTGFGAMLTELSKLASPSKYKRSGGGNSSNSSSPSFPDNIYCEFHVGDTPDSMDSCPLIYYLKGNKARIVSHQQETDTYYNISDSKLQELISSGALDAHFALADKIVKDSSYSAKGNASVNGFSCAVYRRDMTNVVENGVKYTGGYEDYYIYTGDGFRVVMKNVSSLRSMTSLGGIGTESTSTSAQEYDYSFHTVTDADVTPPSGVQAQSMS